MGIFCSSEFAPEMYLNRRCVTASQSSSGKLRRRKGDTTTHPQLGTQLTLNPRAWAGSIMRLEIFV